MRTATRTSWTNWGRNQHCSPLAIRRPSSEDELVQLVKEAGNADQRVKVVGAGHSFTSIACTDGVLVELDDYGRLLDHDATANTALIAGQVDAIGTPSTTNRQSRNRPTSIGDSNSTLALGA